MSVWQNDIASNIGKMENVLIPRLMERCSLKRNAPERKKTSWSGANVMQDISFRVTQ